MATARDSDAKELGRRGEELAVGHLQDQGLVVLARNWRCRHGELDIVATDGRCLVVCEVKTRSGTGFGTPAEAVTPEKRDRLRRLANAWLAHYRIGWCEVRMDIVSVFWPRAGEPSIEHLRGAF
ncbi:MAG: YraN family protein [Sciscionella sp.]